MKKTVEIVSNNNVVEILTRRICHIDTGEESGTGFLAAFNGVSFIVTNYGVVHKKSTSDFKAVFDYHQPGATVVTLPLKDTICSNEQLDYALIGYDDSKLGDNIVRRGYFDLSQYNTETSTVAVDEFVFVYGHPVSPKKRERTPLTYSMGRVKSVAQGECRYKGTTPRGSFGALILDPDYRLIGMHRSCENDVKDLHIATTMHALVSALRDQMWTDDSWTMVANASGGGGDGGGEDGNGGISSVVCSLWNAMTHLFSKS